MLPASQILLATLLVLAVSGALGQVARCAPDGSPQLRFVAQLGVSGCALFVHDTGASDGPHLVIEPVMCVTGGLHEVFPRFVPITRNSYATVPVTLRDDAMLTEVQHQLRHLSPKSVNFANVTDISVSTDAASKFEAVTFAWSPENPIALLSLGCKSEDDTCSGSSIASRLRASDFDPLKDILLRATISENGAALVLTYRLLVQKRGLLDPELYTRKYAFPPSCKNLRFYRSIRHGRCTAKVYERLDIQGHFLIEPLLCHNVTSMTAESVRFDYSRDQQYLSLDVLLQDDRTLSAVKSQLVSHNSVEFMRLWCAQCVATLDSGRRFEIGPLMVSADLTFAELRLYCRSGAQCWTLGNYELDLTWLVTSRVSSDQNQAECLHRSA